MIPVGDEMRLPCIRCLVSAKLTDDKGLECSNDGPKIIRGFGCTDPSSGP
jgi:hypothetical protein